MYQCVIFDMDGTLVNSFEGIHHSYQWACEQMGIPFPGEEFVYQAIGAPLLLVWQEQCRLAPKEARRAAEYYRDYYSTKGRMETALYDGMSDALNRLKKAGAFLGVATLKQEPFAKGILQDLGILSLFDTVRGMDENDRLTKAELILRCMRDGNARRQDTILVGDSEYDADGAAKAGVDFMAVTYGFGFGDQNALPHNAAMTAHTPDDIARLLCART